jgi:hypothetical protein
VLNPSNNGTGKKENQRRDGMTGHG